MTESVRPVRVATEIYDALGYLGTRLLFLNARYAPQLQWGDIALALDGFPTDNLDIGTSGFWEEWRSRWTARADGYVEIALSRRELAQLTGTTLFTVSRLLCQWEAQGIVSARREVVLVHDVTALTELSREE